MKIFKELDSFLKDSESGKSVSEYRDELLFLFFMNGFSYEDFASSPAPYILEMVKRFSDYKKEEAKRVSGKGKGGF